MCYQYFVLTSVELRRKAHRGNKKTCFCYPVFCVISIFWKVCFPDKWLLVEICAMMYETMSVATLPTWCFGEAPWFIYYLPTFLFSEFIAYISWSSPSWCVSVPAECACCDDKCPQNVADVAHVGDDRGKQWRRAGAGRRQRCYRWSGTHLVCVLRRSSV